SAVRASTLQRNQKATGLFLPRIGASRAEWREQVRLALQRASQAMFGLLAVFALMLSAPAFVEAKSRYYLTTVGVQGNAALTACDKDFHMASLWEIHDTSNLEYDTSRGLTRDDSGSGPPTGLGWIRTGGGALSSTLAGEGNCNAWTTNSSLQQRTE